MESQARLFRDGQKTKKAQKFFLAFFVLIRQRPTLLALLLTMVFPLPAYNLVRLSGSCIRQTLFIVITIEGCTSFLLSNPVAFLIPCHRVIRKTGVIGDYGWGSARKKALLTWRAGKNEDKSRVVGWIGKQKTRS